MRSAPSDRLDFRQTPWTLAVASSPSRDAASGRGPSERTADPHIQESKNQRGHGSLHPAKPRVRLKGATSGPPRDRSQNGFDFHCSIVGHRERAICRAPCNRTHSRVPSKPEAGLMDVIACARAESKSRTSWNSVHNDDRTQHGLMVGQRGPRTWRQPAGLRAVRLCGNHLLPAWRNSIKAELTPGQVTASLGQSGWHGQVKVIICGHRTMQSAERSPWRSAVRPAPFEEIAGDVAFGVGHLHDLRPSLGKIATKLSLGLTTGADDGGALPLTPCSGIGA